MEIVLLLGRAVFGLYFVNAAIQNLINLERVAASAGARGVPKAKLCLVTTAPLMIASGLSILLGFYAWIGAILLIVFLIPASLLRHRFWSVSDPREAVGDQRHFEKNMALIGACLLIWYFGSGPYSLH